MGKKLTAAEVDALIAAHPDSQMFDTCCLCGETEPHMEMNDAGNPDTFDVICDECLNKSK